MSWSFSSLLLNGSHQILIMLTTFKIFLFSQSTRTVYQCTWPGCSKLYNTNSGIEKHVRIDHLGWVKFLLVLLPLWALVPPAVSRLYHFRGTQGRPNKAFIFLKLRVPCIHFTKEKGEKTPREKLVCEKI